MGSDVFDKFILTADQLGRIQPNVVWVMIIAILIGILLISFIIIRQLGLQIKQISSFNSKVIEYSEERHNRDIERFEKRLQDAEERASNRDKEMEEARQRHLVEMRSLISQYDEAKKKQNDKIDELDRKIIDQRKLFDTEIITKDNKIAELEGENERLKSSNSKLVEKVENLQAENNSLNEILKTLNKEEE